MATISLKSLHAALAKLDVGLSVHEANRSSGAVIRFTILFPRQPGYPYKDRTHLGLGMVGQSGGRFSWWSLASAFHVGSCRFIKNREAQSRVTQSTEKIIDS